MKPLLFAVELRRFGGQFALFDREFGGFGNRSVDESDLVPEIEPVSFVAHLLTLSNKLAPAIIAVTRSAIGRGQIFDWLAVNQFNPVSFRDNDGLGDHCDCVMLGTIEPAIHIQAG
jgi:hypothetical protein